MKTKLIIRWDRGKEHSESIWERENDGILWLAFAQLIALIECFAVMGKPISRKGF